MATEQNIHFNKQRQRKAELGRRKGDGKAEGRKMCLFHVGNGRQPMMCN